MEIDKMEIKDLKALAYDIIASQQKLQQDLISVNQTIMQKQERKKLSNKQKEDESGID